MVGAVLLHAIDGPGWCGAWWWRRSGKGRREMMAKGAGKGVEEWQRREGRENEGEVDTESIASGECPLRVRFIALVYSSGRWPLCISCSPL